MRRRASSCALPLGFSMKYTPELYSLTVISTATALMWVPYVFARMTTHGLMRAIGNPGPDTRSIRLGSTEPGGLISTRSRTWLCSHRLC
jgi:hypothetical protein